MTSDRKHGLKWQHYSINNLTQPRVVGTVAAWRRRLAAAVTRLDTVEHSANIVIGNFTICHVEA
jgi:hypothetical protein